MTSKLSADQIKDAVKKHYGSAIAKGGCCGSKADIDPDAAGRYTDMAGYSPTEIDALPDGVTSFGCGNPVALMNVKPGETVLDLGSGAGMDLILAARKVGPAGKVIGLDMTPEMIATCSTNLARAGLTNAEVRQGEMEQMPVADQEVDWIISNCVINLSPEKEKVFAEAFRVLKPGGQVMVSDIVTLNLPDEYRSDLLAWVGCLAGAVEEPEYIKLAENAGFVDVKVVEKQVYTGETIKVLANDSCGCGADDRSVDQSMADKYANRVASIRLYARKPA